MITTSRDKILLGAAMKRYYISMTGVSSHWELMKAHQIEPNGLPVNIQNI